VEAHLETPFESMENLLMTISPMFRDRFQQELYNKLQSVQAQQQQQQHNTQSVDDLISLHPSLQPIFTSEPNNTSSQTNKSDTNLHTTTTNDLNSFDELNNWIN
jgi:hypothetical protein